MIVINDGQAITLEELARKMCHSISNYDNDCGGCYDGSCPAADHCRHGHNGMIVWLREILSNAK